MLQQGLRLRSWRKDGQSDCGNRSWKRLSALFLMGQPWWVGNTYTQ